MSGFYPSVEKVFIVERNNRKECYEIINTENDSVHRSGITTRKDANNQAKALNYR